ncbi:hypothetical protein EMPS_03812 [Entomortierella parvispora]|uniref:Uncharacterized protein n=1 Tax=Entomortierella parvispora TaxID=205924 RepID=A0A9P3H836_9FUNG|nr:hypothetical protein EMPS_03812 [Entomortierella parvispora]
MNFKFFLGMLALVGAASASCTQQAAQSMPYDVQVFENDDCSGRTLHIQCDYDHEAIGTTKDYGFSYNSVLVGSKYAVTLYDNQYKVSRAWGKSDNYYFQWGKVPAGMQFVIWCHGSE